MTHDTKPDPAAKPKLVYYNSLPCHLIEDRGETVLLKATGDTWCKGGFVVLKRTVLFPDEVSQHVMSEAEFRAQLKDKTLDQLKAMLPPELATRYDHLKDALLRMQITNALCNQRRREDKA